MTLCLLAAACGGTGGATVRDNLLETTRPALAGLDPFAQAQITTRLNTLDGALAADTATGALAQAFGDVGQVLLAADALEAAEPYLRNAITLAPTDERWPYYLGHVQRRHGELEAAAVSFETALDHGADEASTLIWLGVVYTGLDRIEDAVASYTAALVAQPDAAPAMIGLGEIEILRGNAQAAAGYFESALVADPNATAAHGLLEQAYAALGEETLAAEHAAQAGNGTGRLDDPLMAALPGLLETAQTFENRAFLAVGDRDWTEAAEQFRQAAVLSPNDSAAQMNLGTALVNAGDGAGARLAFLAAERIDPQRPEPHLALGTLYLMAGRYRDAVERFEIAATMDPTLLEARMLLADTLRQSDRPAAALPVYASILTENEDHAEALFGLAVALVQLERWADAIGTFGDGMALHDDDPRFFHAAARLLATAPDETVRDGVLALSIMTALVETETDNIEVGETMAMVMAENAIWVDALNWQRGTLEGARELGYPASIIAQLEANLALYERTEPVRLPWPENHAIFQPGGPPRPELLP